MFGTLKLHNCTKLIKRLNKSSFGDIVELTKQEKDFIREALRLKLEKFRKEGHVVSELVAVLAAEEKYEHFLEQLYRKFGGKTKEGHE